MDQTLNQRKQTLEAKIPDITKTLEMVEFLKDARDGVDPDKKPMRTTFELNDTLYAEAELAESDTVHLWLGVRVFFFLSSSRVSELLSRTPKANVMLSYPLPAAIALLKSKLAVAQSSLSTTIEDLEFLREQMTGEMR